MIHGGRMRKKIVMGNWKMNGQLASVNALLHDILALLPVSCHVDCAVMPPAIYLPRVSELLADSAIRWGAQNVYPKDAGAFTGELSATMLQDYGCHYVLVGHSERRCLFHENEKFVFPTEVLNSYCVVGRKKTSNLFFSKYKKYK